MGLSNGVNLREVKNMEGFNLTIKILGVILFVALVLILIRFLSPKTEQVIEKEIEKELINQTEIILPLPNKASKTSIEEALLKRRSVREYKDQPLSLKEVSQILWAAQGITAPEWNGRTAPSAGALYPLEVYLVVRKAEGIRPGVYQYLPKEHKITKILEDDISAKLARAALGQSPIADAACNLVFSADFSKTISKYGERGIQYVYMEAGHSAQNVYLQVQSLGLGTVVIGAFSDKEVKKLLNMPEKETPLYIMPVGKINLSKTKR